MLGSIRYENLRSFMFFILEAVQELVLRSCRACGASSQGPKHLAYAVRTVQRGERDASVPGLMRHMLGMTVTWFFLIPKNLPCVLPAKYLLMNANFTFFRWLLRRDRTPCSPRDKESVGSTASLCPCNEPPSYYSAANSAANPPLRMGNRSQERGSTL